jgi:hypothetical protein
MLTNGPTHAGTEPAERLVPVVADALYMHSDNDAIIPIPPACAAFGRAHAVIEAN